MKKIINRIFSSVLLLAMIFIIGCNDEKGDRTAPTEVAFITYEKTSGGAIIEFNVTSSNYE